MLRRPSALLNISRQYQRAFSHLPQHSGTFHVRHVRLVRPFFTRKKVNFWILSSLAVYGLWSALDFIIEDEEEETKPMKETVKQVKKATESEKLGPQSEVEVKVEKEDDEDVVPEEQPEDALFIPLTWPQKRPREFYKSEDAEWQCFSEFARNNKRKSLVRNELVSIVGGFISNDKGIHKLLGSPISVKKFWLDIDYPYGPPQEYEQHGIEITDEYIALVIRSVDQFNVARLKNALSPMPLIYSLWESYKMLWDSNVERARKVFRTEPTSRRFPPGFVLPGEEKGERPNQSKITPASTQSQGQWSKLLPPIPQPGQEYADASRAFRKTLAKNWNKGGSVEPPRGTIIVSGLIEVCGPRGICLLDVRAAYEPSESRWVAISLAVRRAQNYVMKPKG